MFVPAAVAVWMWANHFCTAVISVQRFSVIKWWRKWSSIYTMTPVQMFNDDLIEVTLEKQALVVGWQFVTYVNSLQNWFWVCCQSYYGILQSFGSTGNSAFWKINLHFYIMGLCVHFYLLTLTLWYFIENRSDFWGYLVICADKDTQLF